MNATQPLLASPLNTTESQTDDYMGDSFTDRLAFPPIVKQLWNTVQRWRLFIVGIVLGCLMIGLLAALLTTPMYSASSQIEISREQKDITNPNQIYDVDGMSEEFYQTQYNLLHASSLAERVAHVLDLGHNDAFFKAHGVSPAGASLLSNGTSASLTAAQVSARENMAAGLLMGGISIEPVRASSLVNIRYTSRSPQISAQIANAWAEQFVVAGLDRKLATSADARKFLEDRLATLGARLEQSERDVVNYSNQKDIVTLNSNQNSDSKNATQTTLVADNLAALNSALTQATADRITAQSRLSSADSADTTADPAVAALRQKRAEVASDYAKMMVQFEPGYPAARALKEQISALDSAISQEAVRVSGNRAAAFHDALRRENALLAQVTRLKQSLNTQKEDSIQLGIYQREADTNRQLYDALLQRYKELGAQSVSVSNNVSIIEMAKAPGGPSSPNIVKYMGISLLVGLALAALAAIALEQIDEGILEPSQIGRLLHIPLLGHVAFTESNILDSIADPKSFISEAYFSIRSNLAFTTSHGLPRSFMVSSTQPGEGKSTTALALASIIGKTGKKVLLVDADMRSPSMHNYIDSHNRAGLSNLLAGGDNLMELVTPTQYRGVAILPAGPLPPSAAELLSTDRITLLMKEMLENFDHVVVDSPPVLGLTDAPLLGRVVEGCVFVIQAEGAAVRGIRASLARMRMVNTQIFGVVLTKLKHRDIGYGYGYGHGYGYGEAEQTSQIPA